MPVIETIGLSKSYGRRSAVDTVSLTVESGEVYGLLGRNGAGKSTVIGMLLGLVRPTTGSVRLFDAEVSDAGSWRGQVGSLIEAPAFYPHLTGRRNLEVLARFSGLDDGAVDEALDRVGLTEPGDVRYRKYSLGMKQRLGIAAAVLGRPPLVILDEPINGLDPQSVSDIRDLILDLRQEGSTVLLSSHILAEVEQVVDRVGILAQGTLVAEGTLAEIAATRPTAVSVRLRVDDPTRAAEVLSVAPGVTGVERQGDQQLVVQLGEDHDGAVGTALAAAGVVVHEMLSERRSLEDVFLEFTSDERAQADA